MIRKKTLNIFKRYAGICAKPEPKKDYTAILAGVLSVGLYVFLMFILPYLIR